MKPPFLLRPVAVAVTLILTSMTFSSFTNAADNNQYSNQQEDNQQKNQLESQRFDFSIAAGSLTSSVNKIAQVANLTISYDPTLTKNKSAIALNGSYTVKKALTIILEGTRLSAIEKIDGGYTLKHDKKSSNVGVLATTQISIKSDDERMALQQRQQSPNSVVVIDQAQIQLFNDVTAGDMLRRLPALSFEGPPGENKDVRIRGLGKAYAQVLINGRRVPDGGKEREFQVDQLPVQLIERIEIIRAPTANMDAQGIAGTINIILQSTPDSSLFSVTAGVSQLQNSDVKPNININYGGKTGDFGYLLNVNARQRELLKSTVQEKFEADGSLDEYEQGSENQQFDEFQFAPSVNWDISETDQLSLETFLLISNEEKTEEKTAFKSDASVDGKEFEHKDKERLTWSLHGQWQHKYGSNNEFSLGLTAQKSTEDTESVETAYKGEDTLDKIKNETEDKSDQEVALTLKNLSVVGDKHTIISGLEFSEKKRINNGTKAETEGGETTNETEEKDQYNINEKRINLYILDEYVLSERQLLTPGIRLEWTDTDVSNGENTGDNTDAVWTPSLHYLFTWTPETNIRASVTNTTRRPQFDEIAPWVELDDGTYDKPDEVGNPDLLPETALGFDIGIGHYFAKHAGNIGFNAFYRDINDKIETRINFNSSSERYEETTENIGSAKLKGIELDISFNFLQYGYEGLTLSGNVTLIDSEVTDQDTGQKMIFQDQPDYVYNVGFDHEISSMAMNWGMHLNQIAKITNDETKDRERKLETSASQQFLDLYINKSFSNGVQVRFSAKNLLAVERDKKEISYNIDGSIDEIERKVDTSERIISLSVSGHW
jgi:iron complex outermembrane receptor protein